MPIKNALTVDVEDYFQVTAFETRIDRSAWDGFEGRVVESTQRILRLLDRRDVRATFFVLGWVAQKYPHLVREIHEGGHEIGSHGYWHRLVYQQTPDEFRQDVRDSRRLLEDLVGAPVIAYRAPSFSITGQSRWALAVLREEGYLVDSSIYPIVHHRYGVPGAEPGIHEISTSAGPLCEFPPSVFQFVGLNVPVAGGGYFRLYPYRWTRRCFNKINRRDQQPIMFYLHPWEVDPHQPRMGIGSRLSRFRHYVNLASTERKLDRLLGEFQFGRVCDVLQQTRFAKYLNLEQLEPISQS